MQNQNPELFNVTFETDIDAGTPWERSEGHGPVRTGSVESKRPGERVLHKGGRNRHTYLYDWQAACKAARADGWNAEPFDAPNRIERAVQADFDFLRLWCEDHWGYVGVTVTLKSDPSVTDSLWGVETYKDYHLEVADELIANLSTDALTP